MIDYDLIVIGGGASGMMTASTAAARGKKVLLLEKNPELGRKLSITGGGRCNITNAEENLHLLLPHYGDAEQFLYSAFTQFGMTDTFSFFESRGLPLVIQAGKRTFPRTERATDVTRVLVDELRRNGVEIRTGVTVYGIEHANNRVTGVHVDEQLLTARHYILATGGASHPETGSTGDGFRWLAELGLEVRQPTPTLVPLSVPDRWIRNLAGVAIDDVRISFFVREKKLLKLNGRILFTHFGISGPTILNGSAAVADLLHEGEVTGAIDLYPKMDPGALDRHIVNIFTTHINKNFENVLPLLLPTGTMKALTNLATSIIPTNTKAHSISREQRKNLGTLLKALPFRVSGLMGYERAIIADGGLALNEVESKTMRCRRIANLSVTGDLLHIRRPSGGYSLQLCWTTGYVAGYHAAT
jgi:predicted Rossmann fold flavoprotein